MKSIGIIVLMAFVIVGCKVTEAKNPSPKMIYTDIGGQNYGGIKGKIIDPETDEGLAFAKVLVMNGENVVAGAMSDFDGFFQINNIEPGQYDVQVEYLGYQTLRFENVIVKAGQMLEIEGEIQIEMEEIIELKPIIYIYPEDTMQVEVVLDYDGEITHTYPKSNGSWTVKASPDGTLKDANGRAYYGLFWEGKPNSPVQPDCGTVVSKDSLIPFLEASLDQLGLNNREANEFIVFWLPILEQNPYNLLYFAEEDYTEHATLNIDPKPDNIIRVMMVYVPLKTPVDIRPQILPEKPGRDGFTVVEWGGTRCKLLDL
ncbi:MAG: hypothetical protein Crog4KO_03070 [Crocinitomicaceae bacterium]